MAIAPLNLPGYAAPQALDFSSLANLGQVYKKAQAERGIQDAFSNGVPTDAAGLAQLGAQVGAYNPQLGLSLAQLGMTAGQRQQEQERQARLDQRQTSRDAVDDNFRNQSLALQRAAAARASEGPLEKASQRAKAAETFGLTPGSPEHKTYVLTGELPAANTTVQAQTEQRKAAAQSLGLTPDNPAYNSFVLTGKMPREDQAPLTATDKRAILEADEAVQTNRAGITALDEAMRISPQAHTGIGASLRAKAGNMLPDAMVPDRIASKDSSAATANYENLVLGQALGQLKATFGAAPTEGERKILLELQASADKPDNVRQDILRRAKTLAENRLKFNQERADQLRGGSYYKPQPTRQSATSQPQGDPLAAARDAIQRGADPAAVRQRLQQNGIDPSGL
jgi:hypothetical protein